MDNLELLDAYDESVLRRVEPSMRAPYGRRVVEATQSLIYGPHTFKYLTEAVKAAEHQDDVGPIAAGVDFLAQAALRSQRRFARERNDVLRAPQFEREIEHQQELIATKGEICMVSERYGMTRREGRDQVEFADRGFSSLGQEAQRFDANVNYSTFTPQTMLSGEALLAAGKNLDLISLIQRKLQDRMPHVGLSNIVIGQIVSALLQRAKPGELFSTIDLGSGTGATIAGLVLGVEDAVKNCDLPRMNVTGIEGSPKFFNDQLKPFAPEAVKRLPNCHSIASFGEPTAFELAGSQFSLIQGDVLESLRQLRFSKEVQQGVVIITANYCFHRLPRVVKDAIIKEVTRQAPNAIFLIADLAQNGSEVNRRHFNFRDNGILNCGNVALDEVLGYNGYRSFDLDPLTAPKLMDPRLAQQMGDGRTNDAFLKVAYRGPRAAELVEHW